MKRAPGRSNRRRLAVSVIVAGALLMLSVPALFVALAISGATDTSIPGTFLILSATAGMALVGIGAVLYD
ncbi:MAG TPA: hypothetical protein VM409_02150 [Chloroflexia bacterium]|nr:hypothetical protein [Chloroflexia bacterium]